ncbi:MAG: hypothetical protein KC729_16705 [Candidatus Eisenbacteria bacterium]|uniref:Uncharacterized protein n=1 Tax=Eiseniibacteriota bacterium TaxID=2212470 RepID=A0A956M1A4_UNCEI|nr:hypothetical protein [Candidatus Eisenbacteria bacterium]
MIRMVVLALLLVWAVPVQALTQQQVPPLPSWNHDRAGQRSSFPTHGHSHVKIKCTRGTAAVKIGDTWVGEIYEGESYDFVIVPGEETITIVSTAIGGSAGTVDVPGT